MSSKTYEKALEVFKPTQVDEDDLALNETDENAESPLQELYIQRSHSSIGDFIRRFLNRSNPFATQTEPISDRVAYFTQAILTLINLLNYMDRFTIAAVLDDISHYYNISNTQSGLIQTVFICVYMVFAPIFGFLGDRMSRKLITVIGISLWTIFTVFGSFVSKEHFWLFLVFRGLVGIGEASYITVAPTIIGDLFVKEKRQYMIAVFSFAAPMGSGLGFIIGSLTVSIAKKFVAEDSAWQWALRVTPAIGIICIVLTILFVPEPARGAKETVDHREMEATSFGDDIYNIATNTSVIFVTLGFTGVAFVAGTLSFWGPTFVQSAQNLRGDFSSNSVDLIFGVITCTAGILGVFLGALAASFLKKKGVYEADPLVCALSMLSSTPIVFIALMIVEQSMAGAWILIFISEVLLGMNWSLTPNVLLSTVPPNRRSLASGLSNLISHLFGDAGSPTFIGVISDAYERGKEDTLRVQYTSLQTALLINPILCAVGALMFFMCTIFYRRDRKRAEGIISGALDSRGRPSMLEPREIESDDDS